MNATERHAILVAEGWRTRQDGLLWPPADWPDQRARTQRAAWAEHVEQAEHQLTRGAGDKASPDPA